MNQNINFLLVEVLSCPELKQLKKYSESGSNEEFLVSFDDFDGEYEPAELPDEFSVKFLEGFDYDIECFSDEEAQNYLLETKPLLQLVTS